jgi:hypothetical protein
MMHVIYDICSQVKAADFDRRQRWIPQAGTCGRLSVLLVYEDAGVIIYRRARSEVTEVFGAADILRRRG